MNLPFILEHKDTSQPCGEDRCFLQEGDWILRKAFPRVPCQVVRVIPYPGTPWGYLIEHNGAGIPILAGDQVSPCLEALIPLEKRKTMPLKKTTQKPVSKPRKKAVLPSGMNMFGMLE